MLSVFIYFCLYIELTILLKILLIKIYFESFFIILLLLYNTWGWVFLFCHFKKWTLAVQVRHAGRLGLLWRATLFSSCGLAPAGEANDIRGAKPELINFTKLMKFGFLLSYTREWHMKTGKEEKQNRNEGCVREPGSRRKGREGNSSICNEKYID